MKHSSSTRKLNVSRLTNPLIHLVLLTLLLAGLPLAGVWWGGGTPSDYLRFPPRPPAPPETSFSWPVFLLLTVLEAGLYGMLVGLLRYCLPPSRRIRPFPGWGWAALAWLAVAWWLAWTRPDWLGSLRDWTFTPLWLGYIAVVNALCLCWRGWCLLTHRPRFLLGLFPLSALFWWYFEYLNGFVGNWRYLGVENLGAWAYFWHATLPFSTVLPAVVSTTVLLGAFFGPACGLPPLRLYRPRRWAWAGLGLAGLTLVGIGVWPQGSFAALWLAPLVLFVSLQVLLGERSYFHPLREGRWEIVAVPMLAALVCGFFWEMWNYWSWPKWVYHVPWVGRFRIFEMPALGYAGYLPFGLECMVVADWWARHCGQSEPLDLD
ncbi:hypothetical protein MIN45_P0912 [Methylomarinovum tepidoasis]|uniref:Integral membrane protein n=1 Tax=Methylomarinovum tepidoasis TaxID=2840183 RepID=A0AAU9BYE5_9GAMM|nr:hypothetical protein MIN45_P0912 [Methylomarinovum sp. IN45]